MMVSDGYGYDCQWVSDGYGYGYYWIYDGYYDGWKSLVGMMVNRI